MLRGDNVQVTRVVMWEAEEAFADTRLSSAISPATVAAANAVGVG